MFARWDVSTLYLPARPRWRAERTSSEWTSWRQMMSLPQVDSAETMRPSRSVPERPGVKCPVTWGVALPANRNSWNKYPDLHYECPHYTHR